MIKLGNDWDDQLAGEFEKPYFRKLWKFLEDQYRFNTIYPEKMDDIFRALRETSYEQTKVVILGQDPYYTRDYSRDEDIGLAFADGLAFSAPKDCTIPDSLENIFKAICEDFKDDKKEYFVPNNCDLLPWARQGVLLLNTALTVVHGLPESHAKTTLVPGGPTSKNEDKWGWKTFTNRVLEQLLKKSKPVMFLLWGSKTKVQKIIASLNIPQEQVLTTLHPSPMAQNKCAEKDKFIYCKHFSKTNEFLGQKEAINWQIPNVK